MLEYLVMTVLIAFLIFSALNFKQGGSVGNTTVGMAQAYYKQGYTIIKSGQGGSIPGEWCEWGDCIQSSGGSGGFCERSCACPRPALGGGQCAGPSYKTCSNIGRPCPP